jgi:hypothetical protein
LNPRGQCEPYAAITWNIGSGTDADPWRFGLSPNMKDVVYHGNLAQQLFKHPAIQAAYQASLKKARGIPMPDLRKRLEAGLSTGRTPFSTFTVEGEKLGLYWRVGDGSYNDATFRVARVPKKDDPWWKDAIGFVADIGKGVVGPILAPIGAAAGAVGDVVGAVGGLLKNAACRVVTTGAADAAANQALMSLSPHAMAAGAASKALLPVAQALCGGQQPPPVDMLPPAPPEQATGVSPLLIAAGIGIVVAIAYVASQR